MFNKEQERIPVAKAQQHVLHLDELMASMPSGLSVEDSTLMADNVIQQWAMQRLLLDRAELNLSEQQKDVRKQLDEYRRSLIVYLYQQQWVLQNMDTIVKADDILTYYEGNKRELELQEDVVRAIFLKVGKSTKEMDKLRQWMRSSDEELRAVLEDFAMQHAQAIHLNDSKWIPLENLMKLLPAEANVSSNHFKYQSFLHVQDSASHYLIDVKELKQKHSLAPLEYVEGNIITIILNKRRLEMVKKLERDIFDEAVAKNQFKKL